MSTPTLPAAGDPVPLAAVAPAGGYLDHLPAVFRSGDAQTGHFLARFLSAFEDVFGSATVAGQPGLEQLAGGLAAFLDPATYREGGPEPGEGLLPWLASWVALSVRADWNRETTIGFIRHIVPLYRRRGTLPGLREMLRVYLAAQQGGGDVLDDVVIDDRFPRIPHYFHVRLTLRDRWSTQHIVQAIIDQEKPAHTCYGLTIREAAGSETERPDAGSGGDSTGDTDTDGSGGGEIVGVTPILE